jgi:hypothetical protein
MLLRFCECSTFHLARDKVTENLHITERALLPTFLNRLAAVRLKIQQERLKESLIQQVTRCGVCFHGYERPPRRAAEQPDEIAAPHVEHAACLPPTPDGPCKLVYRALSLPQ